MVARSSKIGFQSDRSRNAARPLSIFVMNANGTNVRQLTTDTTREGRPAWSPDGTKLAFVSNQDTVLHIFVSDNAADPGANNVGFRMIHAGAGMGNVDVFLVRRQQDTLALPAATASSVTYGTVGSYAAVAADTGAFALRVVVTAAGTTTPILANVALPTGLAGTPTVNPIAGARVPGSVMTAVLVPASVAGSGAPQGGAFARPNAVILVDRRPPNTAP